MITVLVANRKGGVGKTTTSVNLAAWLGKMGKKTLLIDLDTQGHLQYGLGFGKPFAKGVHSILADGNALEIIHMTEFENLDLMPASINFDVSLLGGNKSLLKKKFEESKIGDIYDICIIDTPPTSDTIIFNALSVGDFALIPMQTEYLGLIGVMQFLKIFYKMAPQINSDFKLLGIVPTMFNKSMKEHKAIIEELKKYVGKNRVFKPIRKDFTLSDTFAKGKPILYVDKRCRGSQDYKELAVDVVEKLNI